MTGSDNSDYEEIMGIRGLGLMCEKCESLRGKSIKGGSAFLSTRKPKVGAYVKAMLGIDDVLLTKTGLEQSVVAC